MRALHAKDPIGNFMRALPAGGPCIRVQNASLVCDHEIRQFISYQNKSYGSISSPHAWDLSVYYPLNENEAVLLN